MASIVGAGIAGASLARLWAEMGHVVHVYEAEGVVGGMLGRVDDMLLFKRRDTVQFLSERVKALRLFGVKESSLTMVVCDFGYEYLVAELLTHPGIRLLNRAQVTDIYGFMEQYAPFAAVAAPLDTVCNYQLGMLSRSNVFPVPDSKIVGYRAVLDKMHCLYLGSAALHTMLSAEQCISQALFIAQQAQRISQLYVPPQQAWRQETIHMEGARE